MKFSWWAKEYRVTTTVRISESPTVKNERNRFMIFYVSMHDTNILLFSNYFVNVPNLRVAGGYSVRLEKTIGRRSRTVQDVIASGRNFRLLRRTETGSSTVIVA